MTVTKHLPFDQVNAAALARYPGILEQWAPGGYLRNGKEYLALNPTRADQHIKSFSINATTGKWSDFSTGDAGGDPISLYAYLFCGGTGKTERTEACRRMAAELGLSDDPAPKPAKAKPHLTVVKGDEWVSIVPPPDDAPAPALAGKVHAYRGPGGRALRYVARVEKPDGTKRFVPHTYGVLNGEKGWHPKHPNPPMCLYGLNRRAANPSGRVLLQEGEQKTDLVQDKLPFWVCMAWSGGANRARDHDYSPVAGADVTVCGDAVDGTRAMMQAAEIAHGLGATVWTVDLSGFPKGWDLGNAATGEMWKHGELVWKSETGPWTGAQIEAFLKERSRPFAAGPAGQDPEDGPDWDDGEPGGRDPRALPPVPLGYDNGIYYYLSPLTQQIEALPRRSHKKDDLIGIAGLRHFEGLEQFRNAKGELNWTAIGDDLKVKCSQVGIFNPDRLRGRGAWIDRGRSVLHLGERLVVDGQPHDGLVLPGSRHVYERKLTVDQTVAPPIGTAQAHELLDICAGLNWERPIFGTLLAGWLVVAPICGALRWRPAVWLTGGTGAGKTTLYSNIVQPLLGEMVLPMAGGSTEAGIRQTLGQDARPIVFDEAEAEHAHGKQRIQNVLELVRQSTSEGGAQIIKGTQSQVGAKRFSIRSCFMFLSINVSLHHSADENRITVLSLRNGRRVGEQVQAEYDALLARIARTITPQYCAGFLARSVKLMPVIRANAATFARAVAAHLGSARIGDQIGTLLAGTYALHSEREISLEDARAWVAKQDWTDATPADAATDEDRLFSHLMQMRVRSSNGGNWERSVGELVAAAAAAGRDENVPREAAERELLRHGFKFQPRNIGKNIPCGVWVANKHSTIARWLDGTPWATSWNRALKRIPGAEPSAGAVYFTPGGDPPRAVFVPVKLPD